MAAEDRNPAKSTESGDRSRSSVRRKTPRATKGKEKPPWEVQGYRGSSVERNRRAKGLQGRQRLSSAKTSVAASPPRVYGVHTKVSEEKSTKGALEAELLRQSQWRERTVPNLSRSFASVADDDADPDDTSAANSTMEGATSPTLSVATSTAASNGGGNLIPPQSRLPESISQLVVKLRSLSYGTSGQDPVKLFRRFDRRNRGGLDQREFGLAVRKGGALTRSQMSDTDLRLLFQAVDKDSDGFISMDELRDFVWGGEDIEAATVESVESRRHISAAALPLTVGSFAAPSPTNGSAPSLSARSSTPRRRAGSPKSLHQRYAVLCVMCSLYVFFEQTCEHRRMYF